MSNAIRIGVFLALAIPLASAFGQTGPFTIVTLDLPVTTQPAPFLITISPQGQYNIQQGSGSIATKVEVEIGTITVDKNGKQVFTPTAGTSPRVASFGPNQVWTAAPYTGMTAKTTYGFRAQLYATTPPAPGEVVVATALKSVTTP